MKYAHFGWICLLLVSVSAQATILPPNDLHLQSFLYRSHSQITESQFNKIISDMVRPYRFLAKAYGVKLTVEKLWNDNTVNAYATQTDEEWKIVMFGGLAIRPEITPDAFALVVCHELGHHFAGFPFYSDTHWGANEGQSDHYATQVCLRKAWLDQKEENAKHRATVSPYVQTRCDQAWSSTESQNLCYRVAHAGVSLANLFSELSMVEVKPLPSTPDMSQVPVTEDYHPDPQCRLDTYFHGALCTQRADVTFIPGRNHPDGQNSEAAERASSFQTCTAIEGYQEGLRPACWFKARF